jgi:hypothetical protein
LDLFLGILPRVGYVCFPRKLPFERYTFQYDLENASDTLAMHVDGVPRGVVDDLLATGDTVGACVKLLEKTGAKIIVGCAFATSWRAWAARTFCSRMMRFWMCQMWIGGTQKNTSRGAATALSPRRLAVGFDRARRIPAAERRHISG